MPGPGEATGSRRITFGDDGSPAADVVWLWLNSHAWPGWEVAVVHAQLPDLTRLGTGAPDADLHPWEPPHPRRAFAEARFAAVRHLTALADPRVALLSCSATDLLALGPHGPGLLKAMHLGSTTEWLMVRPPAPLLVVKTARPVRSAVVCVDGSAHADRAVAALATLPWLPAVTVTVLVALDGSSAGAETGRAAAAVLQPCAGRVQARVVPEPPTPAILACLDREDADLVVLGTRGLTGLAHLLLGSTAGAVARDARCSVLLATAEVGVADR